jgi:hypothetical protein
MTLKLNRTKLSRQQNLQNLQKPHELMIQSFLPAALNPSELKIYPFPLT